MPPQTTTCVPQAKGNSTTNQSVCHWNEERKSLQSKVPPSLGSFDPEKGIASHVNTYQGDAHQNQRNRRVGVPKRSDAIELNQVCNCEDDSYQQALLHG